MQPAPVQHAITREIWGSADALLLRRPLGTGAQEGLYADFRRIGEGLGIAELPPDYPTWRPDRARRLIEDLAWSPSTAALYAAYRRQLGPWRYALLRELQGVLVPPRVRRLLRLPGPACGTHLLTAFCVLRSLRLAPAVRRLLVPARHWHDLSTLKPPSFSDGYGRVAPSGARGGGDLSAAGAR